MSQYGPKNCTMTELMKYGVDLVDFVSVQLQCPHCRKAWFPQHDRGQLVRDYWHCPNGCNNHFQQSSS